jgi:uncharacterized membrane protein YesL
MNYTLDTVPDDFRRNNFAIYAILGCMFYSLIQLLLIDLDAILQVRSYKFAFNFLLFICSIIAIITI